MSGAVKIDGRRGHVIGPMGGQLVRPACRQFPAVDILSIYFPWETLTCAPGSGSQYAYSAYVNFSPGLSLAPYVYLQPDTLGYTINNGNLGGAFLSFLSLGLDDGSEYALNGMQIICTSGYGHVSGIGPTINDVASIGPRRQIMRARVGLQADGPGTATATLEAGQVDMRLWKSGMGRSLYYPVV